MGEETKREPAEQDTFFFFNVKRKSMEFLKGGRMESDQDMGNETALPLRNGRWGIPAPIVSLVKKKKEKKSRPRNSLTGRKMGCC